MLHRRCARSAVIAATVAGLALTAAAPAEAGSGGKPGKTASPKPTASPSPSPAPSPTPSLSPTPTVTAAASPAPEPALTVSPTATDAATAAAAADFASPSSSSSPSSSPLSSPTPTAATVSNAPSGQTQTGGLLPAASLAFPTAATGWAAYSGGTPGFVDTVGRSAPGALTVTTAGPWTGAVSPTFSVAPGARYIAGGYVRAVTGSSTMALGLRFRDSSGAVIAAGSQVAQGVFDDLTTWTQLPAVIGFAPAGAVRGEVAVITSDAPLGEVHYVDDVAVRQITGTAAPLSAPLRTSGRDVLDSLGRRITFRGVHVDGMQWSRSKVITTDELLTAQKWGANLVRLPLNENYATPGDCAYDPTYLSRVDNVVSTVTGLGMLLLVDLHTNALTPCAAPTQQKMPDAGAVQWWTTVATRYRDNPLVGFDLYNEPHDVTDAVWRNGGTVESSGVTYTAAGMQSLYDAVRATGATNLVFASGNNWANTYPTWFPLTSTTNLVYAAHAYTCPNGTPASGASCTSGPGGVLDPSAILTNFDVIGATKPVVVTEFGYPNKYEGRYIGNVIDYVADRGWSGWDVFAFDGTSSGMFDLVKDTGPVHDPAISGMAAMTRMLSS